MSDLLVSWRLKATASVSVQPVILVQLVQVTVPQAQTSARENMQLSENAH